MIRPHAEIKTHLGAEDNLRRVSLSDYEGAEFEEGLRYELIGGVLHVSPSPGPNHQDLLAAVFKLLAFQVDADNRPVFQHVAFEPRLFVQESEEDATVPQPDLAAYLEYPPKPVRDYRGLMPVLVVEIVSPGGKHKDYVRNVEIYARTAILEYWVIDPTRNAARPSMAVFRRNSPDEEFSRTDIASGRVYECERWPGLRVDLARIAVD